MNSPTFITTAELQRINALILKIQQRIASANEMNEFFNLIQKSGQNNWLALENYIRVAGYSSIEQFKQHLNEKSSKEFIDGLVKIGLAVLIAYGLAKLLKEK